MDLDKLIRSVGKMKNDEKIFYRIVFKEAVKVKRKSNRQQFHTDMAEHQVGAKPARIHLIETDLWENISEFDF